MKTCKELLIQLIGLSTHTTLILDALDECENNDRLDLVDALDYLVEHTKPKALKIFISGRPDGNILWKLGGRDSIRISASDNQDDISKFVEEEILKYRHPGRLSETLKSLIIRTLQEKSQGMLVFHLFNTLSTRSRSLELTYERFQWAYLQIHQLLELDLPEDIEERLGKLPNDLKTAYDEIIHRMPVNHQKLAYRAVQWVMCAIHPLSTEIILPAVRHDENCEVLVPLSGLNEGLLLEYCHSLLVIDPVRKIWVTSHLSVNEYFENHVRSNSQANSLVASICLLVLQNTILHDRELDWGKEDQLKQYKSLMRGSKPQPAVEKNHDAEPQPPDPLHGQGFEYLSIYARHYWINHARQHPEGFDKRFKSILEKFLGMPEDSSLAYRCWHRMITEDVYYEPYLSAVRFIDRADLVPTSVAAFTFCRFGISFQLPDWHNYEWVRNQLRTEESLSLLELGCLSGELKICQDLIKHGADVNLQTKSRYCSPLAAAGNGEKEIPELLLQAGADVNMQLQCGKYGSALAAAAGNGKKEIVELLLHAGADVNMQLHCGDYGSALAFALAYRRKGIVGFLIQAGADVNMQLQFGDYGSVLAAVASFGEEGAIESLIAAGADINMRLINGKFTTALAAGKARKNEAQKEYEKLKHERRLKLQEMGKTLEEIQEALHKVSTQASGQFRVSKAEEVIQLLLKLGAKD